METTTLKEPKEQTAHQPDPKHTDSALKDENNTDKWRSIWLDLVKKALVKERKSPAQTQSIYTMLDQFLTANPWPPLKIHLYRMEDFIKSKKDEQKTAAVNALEFFYTKIRYSEEHITKIRELSVNREVGSGKLETRNLGEEMGNKQFPKMPEEHVLHRYELLKKLNLELECRNYSHRTRNSYTREIKAFLDTLSKDPREIEADDIKAYLRDRHIKDKNSASTVNNKKYAIKFFFDHVLEQSEAMEKVPTMKQRKKLRTVLSTQEIIRIIEVLKNPKHKMIIIAAYGTGLRISETVNLKITDFDFDRKLIHVRKGKGRKERIIMF
jgi:hypothetical protein